ncbi:FAD/NAD(P)-binding protein [Enterococcus dongliensis]|uniref:FAD/NAD(P)-binding protein n=1 Tax=Enterococcus dongliensis TaxID=2559925 RepID=UPI002891A35F|nr:FAD/NAD(P)-binding protein [Enterococcus dongliensis]MDT2668428.1 FAD/NAD(P)-binding protein [Enterococcus dongliensis]
MKKIAIVGAGPYGLIALDRLIKQAPYEKIELLVFDPAGPGGEVWRKEQSDQVIMNTVMQHVTLFSEEEGPSLAEWSQTEAVKFLSTFAEGDSFLSETKLGGNDYCQRRYYGVYQYWFFKQLTEQLPTNITVSLIKEAVIDLTVTKECILIQASDIHQVTDVILATGHSPNYFIEGKNNEDYAKKHGLFYQGPGNPSDAPLEKILATDTVIIRGVGLSFFDYLALFVDKWGGRFSEENNHLNYLPSGNEQTLIVGSGRGLPYHTRPKNQKRPSEDAQPQILTNEFMNQFNGSAQELFDLLRKEAELVYYQKKLADTKINMPQFLADYRIGEREIILDKYQIPVEDRLDWSVLFDPAKKIAPQNFPEFVQWYLKKDIEAAALGNKTGAIASAIDTYKEIQAPLHAMLDQEKFTPKEYLEDFFGTFKRNYNFLTVGAPIIRQKQLLALIEAGVVKFLAPEMMVERIDGQFLAYSKKNTSRSFFSKNLIEARLSATGLEHTKNPLLIRMREKGYIVPHYLIIEGKKQLTGAIRVNRKTHQLIAQDGQILPHIYCYGLPLEGLDWLNATSPRPKSKDRIFYLANQMVQTIYR